MIPMMAHYLGRHTARPWQGGRGEEGRGGTPRVKIKSVSNTDQRALGSCDDNLVQTAKFSVYLRVWTVAWPSAVHPPD